MTTTSAAANVVSSLNAGSGVDIQSLAQALVDAEKAPRADMIQGRIDKSTAQISGYGAVSYALDGLRTAFDGLRDVSDYSSIGVLNSQTSAFGVTVDATAAAGSFDVEVSQVAKAQRTVLVADTTASPDGFAETSTAINAGSAFALRLSINSGTGSYIDVSTDTPAGIVSAINAADLDVTAQLIDTGDDGYKVVVTGQTGADNSFTLEYVDTDYDADNDTYTALSLTGALEEDTTDAQASQDAAFTVNGLDITSSTNSVADVIDGVTLNLYTTTSGSATVDLSRDTADVKAKLEELVFAYNDFSDTLDVLGDTGSDVETYGGALAGESYLFTVRNQVRAMITDTSDTAGDNIQAFRDIGISFDRYGQMTFDEGTFDTAVASYYDEIITMMTADTEAQSVYSASSAGAAGAAYQAIDVMLRSTGSLAYRASNAEDAIAVQEERMTELDDQMSRMLTRYVQQFAIMDAIVGNMQKLGEGLKSTFEGMASMYTNK